MTRREYIYIYIHYCTPTLPAMHASARKGVGCHTELRCGLAIYGKIMGRTMLGRQLGELTGQALALRKDCLVGIGGSRRHLLPPLPTLLTKQFLLFVGWCVRSRKQATGLYRLYK